MKKRLTLPTLACLTGLVLSNAARAQAPTAYSVTEINSMMGPSVTMKIYRDGSRAIVENTVPPQGADGKATHTRSFYDLQAGTNITWDMNYPDTPCSIGRFSGDWGDPFKDSASMNADLAKQGAKDLGVETVMGIPAKVVEVTSNGVTFKAWVDTKSGLLLKVEVTQNGQKRPFMEVKEFSMTKPDASIFALPASCKDTKLAPTDNERFATETGGAAADFISATNTGPGSQNSCTVLFKAVYAGSMQPITGYKISVDNVAKTAEMKSGVLRIDNAPPSFNLDLTFPNGGSTALIYRQCPLPQTVLLMVQKDPSDLGKGADWMWVKSGKFAK